ncbi:MAG: hypothetical protein ABEI39_04215 [Halobacteriales archaeon]
MIGIVAPDGAGRLRDALADAGRAATVGDPDTVAAADPAFVLAVGDAAAVGLARAGTEAPVLPVGTDEGLRPVGRDRVLDVIRSLPDDPPTRSHPVLSAAAGGDPAGRALLDVALFTTEPGHISEYAVTDGDLGGRFRADGAVLATPAGSHGYANAAGGPLLRRGADLLVAVPVAPFGLRSERWVFDLAAPPTLSVERDEAAVALFLDGEEHAPVAPGEAVTVETAGTLDAVEVERL